MSQHFRCVFLGLGAVSSLVVADPAAAQVRLEVQSVRVEGVLQAAAACPGREVAPEPIVLFSDALGPAHGAAQATATNLLCSGSGSAQCTVSIYQLSSRSLQITGSTAVSTLSSALLNPPGNPFASAESSGDVSVTVELFVPRWCQLSYVGTLTVGTVAAIGLPQRSSASLEQSWALLDRNAVIVAERGLSIESGANTPSLQDTSYNSILAGPGLYRLSFRAAGEAEGELAGIGTTGWTCSGTFGVAVSVMQTCAADWDRNGDLDSRDIFEFLNGYFLDATDFNEDNSVDTRDLFDFMNAFLQGCE